MKGDEKTIKGNFSREISQADNMAGTTSIVVLMHYMRHPCAIFIIYY